MEWTIGDWFMAMAGEVGEGADELLPLMFMAFVGKIGQLGNMAKKYRRVQEGIANKSDDPERQIDASNALVKMFHEIADVQIYLDLFALRLREALNTGEDIGDHVEQVFNATSKKYGFPERLVNGKFMLATVGKFKIGEHGREYEGEIYSDPPEPPDRTINMKLDDIGLLHMADALGIDRDQAISDIHKTKYRAEPWPDTLARYAAGAPYSEQPFNERHIAPLVWNVGGTVDPYKVCTIIAPEGEAYFSETLEEDVTFGSIEWVIDRQVSREVQTFKLDEPIVMKAGETYKIGIRNHKPVVFVVPKRPDCWQDGCMKCRWVAMDPYCNNPTVKAAAGATVGIGLNAALQTCTKDGLLDLFEPRDPRLKFS